METYAFGGYPSAITEGRRFSFARHLGADDLGYVVESSRDLTFWQAATDWHQIGESALSGPFATIHWERSIEPNSVDFIRVRAVKLAP